MSKKSEAAKVSYYWYKSHGICPKCRTEKPEPGRTCCPACLKSMKEKDHSETYARRKVKYHELKASGICVTCWKTPAVQGRTRCESCLAMFRESNRKCRARKETTE